MSPENKTFYQDPGDTTEFAGSDEYPGVAFDVDVSNGEDLAVEEEIIDNKATQTYE